ncbi:MAG: cation:proton antiporter [Luteolibacter sp.]
MKRTAAFYILLLGIVSVGIILILKLGAGLPAPSTNLPIPEARHAPTAGAVSISAALFSGLKEHLGEPLGNLFLQLLVIISASRLMGGLFAKLGQPSVVGEMAAGIILGPSLFKILAPGAFLFVFPAAGMGTLKLLSQVGVCLFMFSVGMDLNVNHVRKKAHTAVVVSHASIVIPYFLGVVLAYFLFSSLAQPGTSFLAFALFLGISMSITAFPVLARILQDRGLSKTFLGSTAITCAAVDDVTAWSILAFVVAIVQATSLAASALNLTLVVAFVLLMIYGVRVALPLLLGAHRLEQDQPSKGVLAVIICVVLGAALFTEIIGIHALFGAFLAGAIMPEIGGFRHKLNVRIENFSSVLLLPLFFAFTGLRTQVGLLNDLQGWLTCLLIIAVATAGKLGGTAISARFVGMSWRESLKLGALMNTRGLMELIALNIGFDLGILSPRIFTMLVIMALVTTMLTGPLLSLFGMAESVRGSDELPSIS